MLNVLFSNTWSGIFLELLLLLIVLVSSLAIVKFFALPVGLLFSLSFLLGVAAEKIHVKRKELSKEV